MRQAKKFSGIESSNLRFYLSFFAYGGDTFVSFTDASVSYSKLGASLPITTNQDIFGSKLYVEMV